MITIVIAAYNAEGTIAEALDSVTAQTWLRSSDCECEIIVVDDASGDGTAKIVESWIRELDDSAGGWLRAGSRIIRLQRNQGPAGARNRGIAEAKGEWIAFLDADDTWLPEKVAIQMRLAQEHPDATLICGETKPLVGEKRFYHSRSRARLQRLCRRHCGQAGDPEVTEERGGRGEAKEKMQESRPDFVRREIPASVAPGEGAEGSGGGARRIPLEEFAAGNPVATSTVLVKKAAIEAVGGFDEQFRGPEDYDLWMRIAAMAERGQKAISQRPRSAQRGGDDLPPASPEARGPRHTAAAGSVGMQAPEVTEETRRCMNSAHAAAASEVKHRCAPGDGRKVGIIKTSSVLSRYRYVPGSLSMDDRTFLPQVMGVLEKAFGDGGVLAGHTDLKDGSLSNQYWNAAWMAFQRGARGDAAGHWRKAYGFNGRAKEPVSRKWFRMLLRYLFGHRSARHQRRSQKVRL